MNLIDRIILEWSYRTKKGYPDINNKEDLAVFESTFGFNLKEGKKERDAVQAIISANPGKFETMSNDSRIANKTEISEKEFIKAIKDISGDNWKVGSIERQTFYEEAKKSYAIVTTTDARPFGCFIITKGVIKPDGSVWVLEK